MSEVRPIDDESMALARQVIRSGGLLVLPTDTVYGIACDPRNADAIARLYAAKDRPSDKALQVIMASVDDLDAVGLDLPAPLDRLARAFLPGGLSPVAEARQDCTLATLRVDGDGQRTQAIRVPDNADLLRVLHVTGPVAASSANRSGERSAQTVQEAVEAFGDLVDLYLDGGPTYSHVASTVVAADPTADDGVAILREGVIGASLVRAALHGDGGVLA